MTRRVSKKVQQELIGALRQRYRDSTRKQKTAILDEFIALTEFHRKHAIRLLAGAVLFVLVAGPASAEGKSVAVPKGTKVEKLGPGSFKLTTPDGTVFAVTSYKKAARPKTPPGATAIIGDCSILGDCGIRDDKGKIIATGANGVLKGKPATAQEVKAAPPADYIRIDDEVTWLPAVIEFPSLRVFNRTALNKLSP